MLSGIPFTSPKRDVSLRKRNELEVANCIIAANISLAGLTPDKTSMGVCVGPFLTRNTHVVEIPLDSSNVSMHIHNKPSTKNPTTSIMTSQSVIALLSHFHSILHIGT